MSNRASLSGIRVAEDSDEVALLRTKIVRTASARPDVLFPSLSQGSFLHNLEVVRTALVMCSPMWRVLMVTAVAVVAAVAI